MTNEVRLPSQEAQEKARRIAEAAQIDNLRLQAEAMADRIAHLSPDSRFLFSSKYVKGLISVRGLFKVDTQLSPDSITIGLYNHPGGLSVELVRHPARAIGNVNHDLSGGRSVTARLSDQQSLAEAETLMASFHKHMDILCPDDLPLQSE